MFSGQVYTTIIQAYHCYHECIFTFIVNVQQSCFYCYVLIMDCHPEKIRVAVGNWETVQSYPPVCSWCWISEAHAYLSQFKSSEKVILYLH